MSELQSVLIFFFGIAALGVFALVIVSLGGGDK